MPSGSRTASRRYCENGMPGAGDVVGERLEAGVGVDPPPAGGHRLRPVRPGPEAWASRWRTVEPRRSGRLVEVDRLLLEGHEHGEGA